MLRTDSKLCMPATFTAICGLQMAQLHVLMGNLKSPRSALGLYELKCASRFRRRVYNTFRRPLTSDTRFTQSSPRLPFGFSHLTVVLFVLFELDRLIIQDTLRFARLCVGTAGAANLAAFTAERAASDTLASMVAK